MKGVILAAGFGKRMVPLALQQPKPMLPIANRPLIEHIIDALRGAGISEMLIVTGFLADQIEEYFADGEKFGVKITYRRQEQMNGTAKAAQLAQGFVQDEPFLLVYGDIMTEAENYVRLVEEYKKNRCVALMSLAEVDNPASGGAVYVNDGQVTQIVEKPKSGLVATNYINAGIYIFEPLIFEKIRQTELSERGEYELTTSIQKLIDRNLSVRAFVIKGSWSNVTAPREILTCNKVMLDKLNGRGEGIIIGEGSEIDEKCKIEPPVLIGKNCQISACHLSRYTCLGDNIRIDKETRISESVILNGTHIEENSLIRFATIGLRAKIGKKAILAGTEANVFVVPDEGVVED